MKQTLAAGEGSPAAVSVPACELVQAVLLSLFPAYPEAVLQISRVCETRAVQLGDELDSVDPDRSLIRDAAVDWAVDRSLPESALLSGDLSGSLSDSQSGDLSDSQSGNLSSNLSGDLWLVCQGKVRLVCADSVQANALSQSTIAAVVLEAGDWWGADSQFCDRVRDRPLPYRAVAASAGLIALLPASALQQALQQLPPLKEHLQQVTLSRQRLLFFKTATLFRSQPSLLLKRLLPYVTETQVAAGAVLAEATPTSGGRYWLRQGRIGRRSHNYPNADSGDRSDGRSNNHSDDRSDDPVPPAIGNCWGYPDGVPEDWIAETDLQLYQLSSQHWEIAETSFPPLRSGQEVQPARIAATRLERVAVQPVPANPSVSQPPAKLPALPEASAIDFAKPAARKRRWLGQSYPFIQQQSSSDCGAACLAMIAQYWGKRLSLNLLRSLAGVGRSGASLRGLATAAESLGFLARPVRASVNRMAEQTTPWIAHWQGDHYVVVYRIRGNRVLLSDPAVGRRSLNLAEFQTGWTGYALLLTPTEFLQALPTAKFSLGRFWGAFTPYRSMLMPIVLASILLQVLGVITPLFTQIILDQVVVHKNLITLNVFIIGLLLCSTWRIGLVSIRQYFLDYFSNQVDLTLISGFISHTLNLPLQFFASRHVGDIVTRVQENHKVQLFLTRQVFATGLDALMAFVYVGLMFYYNWQLTILVLGLLPPIALLTGIASPFLRHVSRQIFHDAARQNSSLVEMLTGIAAVKAAAAERDVRWQWEEDLTSQFNAQFRGQKLANLLQGLSGFIHILGSTALLWYGASLVIHDRLTIGQLVAFNMMIGSVIGPVLALVGLWDELQEVMVSVERLEDIFNTPAEESADKPLLTLPTIRGEVCFENVTFRYTADDPRNILQNVSFTAHPGETIALVGRSGSGKTTLANLLQCLYHPSSGRITIDGHDIRHLSPQSLRHQLGIVPQECFLFSGTILDNITLYRPEYSLDAVIEVAKLAEAHAFIQNLPLGYASKVGERGSTLSGGQRQRIAIARALLSNPRILILDEATSSLDTESERRFQKNLHYISRDRTTFIIAHRLATVRHADRILVLDQGIVVEQGTHDQLIAKQGLYAQLAQQQLDV